VNTRLASRALLYRVECPTANLTPPHLVRCRTATDVCKDTWLKPSFNRAFQGKAGGSPVMASPVRVATRVCVRALGGSVAATAT
jgi:hypothetical protein